MTTRASTQMCINLLNATMKKIGRGKRNVGEVNTWGEVLSEKAFLQNLSELQYIIKNYIKLLFFLIEKINKGQIELLDCSALLPF